MLTARFIFLFLFPFCLISQTNFSFEQLNPRGPALDPIGIKVFPNSKALLNTNSPFILKFNAFSDSAWRQGNYNPIICPNCLPFASLRVWTEAIFSKGGYFTKNGGNTWIKEPNNSTEKVSSIEIRDLRGQLILEIVAPKNAEIALNKELIEGVYLLGFKLKNDLLWQRLLIQE